REGTTGNRTRKLAPRPAAGRRWTAALRSPEGLRPPGLQSAAGPISIERNGGAGGSGARGGGGRGGRASAGGETSPWGGRGASSSIRLARSSSTTRRATLATPPGERRSSTTISRRTVLPVIRSTIHTSTPALEGATRTAATASPLRATSSRRSREGGSGA